MASQPFCVDQLNPGGLISVRATLPIYFKHRSPKLLVRIWCLYAWLWTSAVYYKTLYGNLLYPWIFYRNKTCKTILFHLLVQCLFLLLHVESWAVSSFIERVQESSNGLLASYRKWKVGEVEEGEGRKPSWFTGKTHHTLSAKKSSHALRSVQELASNIGGGSWIIWMWLFIIHLLFSAVIHYSSPNFFSIIHYSFSIAKGNKCVQNTIARCSLFY